MKSSHCALRWAIFYLVFNHYGALFLSTSTFEVSYKNLQESIILLKLHSTKSTGGSCSHSFPIKLVSKYPWEEAARDHQRWMKSFAAFLFINSNMCNSNPAHTPLSQMEDKEEVCAISVASVITWVMWGAAAKLMEVLALSRYGDEEGRACKTKSPSQSLQGEWAEREESCPQQTLDYRVPRLLWTTLNLVTLF